MMLRHPIRGHEMTSKWPQRPTPRPHFAGVTVNLAIFDYPRKKVKYDF